MERYETGKLVRSKVGHDAGSVYIIIKEEGDLLYLTDGKRRPLEKLKKKKKKHVQPINIKADIQAADNLTIKKIIKEYLKEV